jgi:GT2 family glycosyltransferase
MLKKKEIITASLVLYNNEISKIYDLLNSINFNSIFFQTHLYIVDNSENPIKFDFSKYKFIKIKYYFLNKNIGFGAGHNYAVKKSIKSKFHFLLNPDIYFQKSHLVDLYKKIKASRKTVAMSGVLLNIDKSIQFNGRKDPKIIKLFFRRFLTSKYITYLIDDNFITEKDIFDVDNLSGAFMLVRKKYFYKAGLFDERFFLYLEDFDLSRKLREYGKLQIYQRSKIYHHRARGSYHDLKLFLYHSFSIYRYIFKWFSKKANKNNSRPKIFIISTSGFIIENFFWDQIKALSINNDIKIFSPFNSYPSKKINKNTHGFIDFYIERKINLYQDIKSFLTIIICLLINKPKMVISLGPKAGFIVGLASFICNIKLRVFIFQGQVWANKKGFYRFYLKLFDKFTAYFNNKLLSVSPHEKKYLYENKITKKNIDCLGSGSICGLDLRKYENKYQSKKNDTFTFAFIGRMNYDKGILDLLESFKKVNKIYKNTKLLFIGIDEVGISKKRFKNVKFFSYRQDLSKIFKEIDCLVLPSYREALPIIILESFASKRPVIGSDIYGINYLVKNNESGLLFPPGDVKSLSDMMQLIMKDNSLRKRIVKNAFSIMKNFSNEFVSNNYIKYFNNILKADNEKHN